MAFQLDDLLKDDKKDNLIPDLSKATCESQEELRRLLERCPEYKIKTEKVRKDDAKVRDKAFSWKITKKELAEINQEWKYGNPVPPDMRSMKLYELHEVDIDWKMLTSLRPKLQQDEDMFSRLVEMRKLERKTWSKRTMAMSSPVRRCRNRAGIIESSVKVCDECGDEFCSGEYCGDILYDSFIRVSIKSKSAKLKVSNDTCAILSSMSASSKGKKRKNSKSKVRTTFKTRRQTLRHSSRRNKLCNKFQKSGKKEKKKKNGNSPRRCAGDKRKGSRSKKGDSKKSK